MTAAKAAPQIRRRFVQLDGRRVHYLRAGSGSPVLLVHPSPANASLLTPMIRRLAMKFTVFAFDTPGFGASDPIHKDAVTIADIADALADTLEVMGFPQMPVFGTHTGAGIALELGVRHPHRVSGLVLDGVPVFIREEVEARIADGYFYKLEPHELGGHLTNTWTRFRDQMTYHPWCTRTPGHANVSGNFATAENTHSWVSMFYQCAAHFEAPYLAAHFFGEIAAARIGQLDRPAVFTAASTDGLSKHLNRFPALKPDQSLVRLGPEAEDMIALIDDSMLRFTTTAPAPPDPAPPAGCVGIDRHFIDLPSGQVHVRMAGADGLPPLLFLHDAPGSAHAWETQVAALGLTHRVYAPDLPGSGESDPLPGSAPNLGAYVAAMKAVLDGLGVDRVAVFGIGFGASLAIELARQAPERVGRLVLRGVLLPDAEDRADMQANFAPPITLDPAGGHWYRTWLMLRDSLTYWPWYRRTKAAVRLLPADFGAQRLPRLDRRGDEAVRRLSPPDRGRPRAWTLSKP